MRHKETGWRIGSKFVTEKDLELLDKEICYFDFGGNKYSSIREAIARQIFRCRNKPIDEEFDHLEKLVLEL